MPDASVRTLGRSLLQNGYQVFMRQEQLYAFKGLAGKYGPLGVHASMLAIMAGKSGHAAVGLALAVRSGQCTAGRMHLWRPPRFVARRLNQVLAGRPSCQTEHESTRIPCWCLGPVPGACHAARHRPWCPVQE